MVTLRFLSDGSLDPSFGDEGVVSTAVTADGSAVEAVSVQADGKIVVAGSFGQSLDEGFVLARYLPDGTPDPTFRQ